MEAPRKRDHRELRIRAEARASLASADRPAAGFAAGTLAAAIFALLACATALAGCGTDPPDPDPDAGVRPKKSLFEIACQRDEDCAVGVCKAETQDGITVTYCVPECVSGQCPSPFTGRCEARPTGGAACVPTCSSIDDCQGDASRCFGGRCVPQQVITMGRCSATSLACTTDLECAIDPSTDPIGVCVPNCNNLPEGECVADYGGTCVPAPPGRPGPLCLIPCTHGDNSTCDLGFREMWGACVGPGGPSFCGFTPML